MANLSALQLNDIKNHDQSYLETIFSIANGHFGIRASDPIDPSPTSGTLVNGFYETNPITYGESAFGYAKNHQTIANLPDLRKVTVTDGSGNIFDQSTLLDSNLDFETGELIQSYQLETSTNESITLKVSNIIAQINLQVMAIRYEFFADNYDGIIKIKKDLTLNKNIEQGDDPRKVRQLNTLNLSTTIEQPDQKELLISTQNSHLSILMQIQAVDGLLDNQTFDLKNDTNVATYLVGISKIDYHTNPEVINLSKVSYQSIENDAVDFWKNVWKNSLPTITGDDSLTQAIRYNIFQMNQSVGRDGLTNIAAKGLSGTGYEGHYFWDTEMYMLPYFSYTNPNIAKQLLNYRYHTLDQAKKQARTLGVDKGVLFPWRTINGEEASAYYPAGTAQYHINGDIAYAVNRYYQITQDIDWLVDKGYELILETARFWASFGHYRELDGQKRFEFSGVTGPNEYTVMVDNNYYTNKIAQNNLALAADLSTVVKKKAPEKLQQLGVSDDELKTFAQISDDIYLPYNEKLGINAQDDSFLNKPLWPFDTTPKENYPLLLHYHPLTIYRHQVAKQADTILAEFLFPENIDERQLKREYDYYEAITTHDSSLSRSVFSIVAARLHETDKAYHYFMDTAKMDLVDMQGNTEDGLHLSNLGGSWLSLTAGFAGMTVKNGCLHLENNLPKQWQALMFRVRVAQSLLEVKLTAESVTVDLLEGPKTNVKIDGKWESVYKTATIQTISE